MKIKNDYFFFLAKVLNKFRVLKPISTSFNRYRHSQIMHSIYPYLAKALEETYSDKKVDSYINNGPIWIFWWQGEENMPALVKECYNSVLRNKCNRNVILITKYNFRDYTNISKTIIKKFEKGFLTVTHFSDILRFNLLKNNGGLWLDATIFVNKPLPNKYFNGSLFTCPISNGNNNFFVSEGKWTGFIIGGSKKNELFDFMNKFFELYWKDNNNLIDYFLIDYALSFAWQKNLGHFKEYTENNRNKNNPHLYDLYPLLNSSFNPSKFKLIQQNTEMYKLSYKGKVESKHDTFYEKVVIQY